MIFFLKTFHVKNCLGTPPKTKKISHTKKKYHLFLVVYLVKDFGKFYNLDIFFLSVIFFHKTLYVKNCIGTWRKKKISQLKKKYQHKKNHHRLILTCFGIKNGISRKTYSMIIELEIRVEISYRNFSRSNWVLLRYRFNIKV